MVSLVRRGLLTLRPNPTRSRADARAAGPGAPATGAGGGMSPAFSISCRSGRSSSASASFSMCFWTVSTWASASSMASPRPGSRNPVMNSIAPIWDGNETWLVLGGIGLLAAFPLAFAIIIPAVYFPILVMLLALVFRGVAFEFRYATPSIGRSGTTPSTMVRSSARSRKALCSALHPGLPDGGPPLLRRLVRLLHAVLAADRRRAGVRLRPAWRGLADPEDRRRASGLGAGARALLAHWRSDRDRCGQLWTPVAKPRSPSGGSLGPISCFWRRCRSSLR